jgi:hypothetical protein
MASNQFQFVVVDREQINREYHAHAGVSRVP